MALVRSYILDRQDRLPCRKHWISDVGHLKHLVLPAIFVAGWASGAAALERVNRDEYPFSIMKSEPGERRTIPDARRDTPPDAQPQKEARKTPRRVRRGSSTFSTIPTYRSPLTPLGTAPTIGTAPSMANPASPSVQVPGVRSNTGVAVTPPRPAGQGFPDRAVSCVQSGTASGVSPGQIGTFTRSCVNR